MGSSLQQSSKQGQCKASLLSMEITAYLSSWSVSFTNKCNPELMQYKQAFPLYNLLTDI